MFPNKKCSECWFSQSIDDVDLFKCGFICKLNPRKPIFMGFTATHGERKKNKKEQYPKKDS